jgi:hypothetical protein
VTGLGGDDEEITEELHALAHGAHDFLESLDENVKKLLKEYKDWKSRPL